jgi:transposase
LSTGYKLLQQFHRLIVRRSVRDLEHWLKDAGSSGLRPFVSLAHGIQADYAAVVNGLKLRWSTGPVEGTVTKVNSVSSDDLGERMLYNAGYCAGCLASGGFAAPQHRQHR